MPKNLKFQSFRIVIIDIDLLNSTLSTTYVNGYVVSFFLIKICYVVYQSKYVKNIT